jgi:hypothetical protein
MDNVKVLFLAANPAGTPLPKLDEGIRQLSAKFGTSEHRDPPELVSRWAVRPDDLMQALLEVRPHVVHFSGHGSKPQELILLDDRGNPKPVSREALLHLFRTLKDNVRVVVLNACSSPLQAKAVAEAVDCTVSISQPIGEAAALVFAASFYRAVGFGRSVKEAFELGKAALLLGGFREDKTPRLRTRPGVDAARVLLLAPPGAAMSGAEQPAATGPRERPGVPPRLALVRELSSLAPADFATLVTAIPGAATHVGHHGTVAEQVAELVRFAESPTGPGLAALEEVARSLRNPQSPRLRAGVSRRGTDRHPHHVTSLRTPSETGCLERRLFLYQR